MADDHLTQKDKDEILDAIKRAKVSVLRGQHANDKAIKLLEEVMAAYRGCGDLPGALMEALIYLRQIGRIHYNEDTVHIYSELVRDVLMVLGDIGKTPEDERYEIVSLIREAFEDQAGDRPGDTLVEIPYWAWSSLLWGPAAHIGMLPNQPGYDVMCRARMILQQGGKAEAMQVAERFGIEAKDLEELVHDMAAESASSINNGGIEKQIEYLHSMMGTDLIPELEKLSKESR